MLGGLVLAWPGCFQGVRRKEPSVSGAVLLGGGGGEKDLGEAQGHFLALAAPRPWVGISAEWQREGSQISCLVCGLKPQLLGFPWLLERQPFGEVPVFPGGAGRAAHDTWIPLLPISSSLCEEGIEEFLASWTCQPTNVTSY